MLTWRGLGVLLCVGFWSAACAQSKSELGKLIVDKKVEALVKHACQDSVDAVYEDPGELEAWNENRRGDIVRCATGEAISIDALRPALAEAGFANVEVKSALQIYRISYRTQRAFRGPDVASALVVVPSDLNSGYHKAGDDKDARDPAEQLRSIAALQLPSLQDDEEEDGSKRGPLVVFGHGTSPYRQDCAISRSDPLRAEFLGGPDLELRMVLSLAAQGWPVIAPDYAGFVEGSPVTGYMFAEDEAYSVLDSTRAMKKLLDKFPDQTVLVGHSQGGHAMLSAQAYEKEYGMDGKLAGVVAFAPFWAPARTFGVIIWPESGYRTDDAIGSYALNTAVEYFYTHAELIDGPGRGQELLTFDIDDLIGPRGAECNFFPDLTPYGETGLDLFIPEFAAVATCAATGNCSAPIAQTWAARFQEDRPALDPKGAPVLMWHGAQDTVVPVSIAGCAVDKIRQDFSGADASATFELCADPIADHELVESNNAGHAIQWINARVHGAPEPTLPCGSESLLEGLDCFIGNQD